MQLVINLLLNMFLKNMILYNINAYFSLEQIYIFFYVTYIYFSSVSNTKFSVVNLRWGKKYEANEATNANVRQ